MNTSIGNNLLEWLENITLKLLNELYEEEKTEYVKMLIIYVKTEIIILKCDELCQTRDYTLWN